MKIYDLLILYSSVRDLLWRGLGALLGALLGRLADALFGRPFGHQGRLWVEHNGHIQVAHQPKMRLPQNIFSYFFPPQNSIKKIEFKIDFEDNFEDR